MGKEESSTKNKPAIREEREALEEIPMPQAYRFHNVVENSIPLIRSNSDSEIISKGTKYSGSWQCTLCFHVNEDTVKQVCAMCGTPTGGDSRMTPRQQKIVHDSEEPPKEEPPLVDEKGNSLLGVKEETEEDAAKQKKSQKALDHSVPDTASDMTDILDNSSINNNNDNSSNDNNNGITMSTPNSDNILYSNKSNNQSCERLSILDSSDEENDELLFTANGVEPNYYSSSTTAAQKRQGGDGTAAQEFSFNGVTTTTNDDDLQLCIDSAIAPLFSQTKTTTTTATTKAPPHVQVEISDIESNISAEEEDNFVFENKVQTSRKVWMLRLAFLSLVFLVVLLSLLLVRK